MAKEHFFHPQTQTLFKKLEELSRRSGVSRGQAFEDWLTAMVCALAAETKEPEYLAMAERHKGGNPGERGIDLMGRMFGELVCMMDKDDGDILGDLFEGGITYGENGQYLTPEALAHFMAGLSLDADARPTSEAPIYVNDACCGSGRMLLEAAKINPHVELVGQDIDARCVRITAINLGLRGRFGWVICGNSLTNEATFAYRVGSFFNETPRGVRRGVIREVPLTEAPVTLAAAATRRNMGDVLSGDKADETLAAGVFPAIIEVPRWLARLEPRLAAAARERADVPAANSEASPSQAADDLRKQQTLF